MGRTGERGSLSYLGGKEREECRARPPLKEIQTARLLLRPFRETDLDDLYEFLSQLRDDEFEGYPGVTRESAGEHLRERIGSGNYYAVQLADTGKVIGHISRIPRDFGAVEVGFIMGERFRRRGYALEALAAVMENAFAEGAHRVYAECDPRNVPSWMLLEKAGFQREARFRQNIFT